MAKVVTVGREQHERAEARRTDGIAFGDRLRRVADRIESIRGTAHFCGKPSHLRNAARIVGHGPEGVERNHKACKTQHRRCGNRRAKQAGQRIRGENTEYDDQRRHRRRLE